MSQTVSELIPYLREISFSAGFGVGLIVSLLVALYWRS